MYASGSARSGPGQQPAQRQRVVVVGRAVVGDDQVRAHGTTSCASARLARIGHGDKDPRPRMSKRPPCARVATLAATEAGQPGTPAVRDGRRRARRVLRSRAGSSVTAVGSSRGATGSSSARRGRRSSPRPARAVRAARRGAQAAHRAATGSSSRAATGSSARAASGSPAAVAATGASRAATGASRAPAALARSDRAIARSNRLVALSDRRVALGHRRVALRRRGLVSHNCVVGRDRGLLHHPRAREVPTHRECRQRRDRDPEPREVAQPLERLTRVPAHRRADRVAGVMPEQAERRTDREPGAGRQQPASRRAARSSGASCAAASARRSPRPRRERCRATAAQRCSARSGSCRTRNGSTGPTKGISAPQMPSRMTSRPLRAPVVRGSRLVSVRRVGVVPVTVVMTLQLPVRRGCEPPTDARAPDGGRTSRRL